MNYTYFWLDAANTSLKRVDEDGNEVFIPADSSSPLYREMISTEAEVTPYVEPAPKSTEEKVNELLQTFDLTREEMQAALATKTKGGN